MKETDMNSTLRQPKSQKRLYTIEKSATYPGRTPWAVRQLVWRGTLPCVRIGRRMQIDIRDLTVSLRSAKG